MDAKITLSFDREVIEQAKKFARQQNMSLSRLTEFLLRQVTSQTSLSLEELPIAVWVSIVAEGPAEYRSGGRSRKSMKNESLSPENETIS